MLILVTNLIDKDSFKRVNQAIESIYEDRLVVSEMLFDISNEMFKKELAFKLVDTSYYEELYKKRRIKISDILSKYKNTKLTDEEARIFEKLQLNLENIREAEDEFIKSGFTETGDLDKHIQSAQNYLADLSEIQVKQGKKQVELSKKDMGLVELFTKIEIYILVILAVFMQITIMYKPKKSSGKSEA